MTARRHHYLSQCYLDGFAANRRKPQLFVVDQKDMASFTTSTENIAVERDFHRIDIEGVAPDAVETKLSEFETEAAEALKRIIAARSIANRDDFGAVLAMMALFTVKNPARREMWRGFEERTLKMVMELATSKPEIWAAQTARAKAAGFLDDSPEISYEAMRDFVRRDEYRIDFATHHHLRLELKVWDTAAEWLAKRNWILLRAPPGRAGFVTTDHPFCLTWVDAKMRASFYPPGLGLTGTQVYFPLSNELAVIGSFERQPGEFDAPPEAIAQFNGLAILHAMRQVYAASDEFLWTIGNRPGLMRGSDMLADLKTRSAEAATAEAGQES